MSYEKLGFVSGQILKAEHLNHMEEGIANTSWNDLTDKPFGEDPNGLELVCNFTISAPTTDPAGRLRYTTQDKFVPTIGKKYRLVAKNAYGAERIGEYECVYTNMMGMFDKYIIGGANEKISASLTSTTWEIVVDNENGTFSPQIIELYEVTIVIKTLDPKYLPAPKLLGEITLTSENCSTEGGSTELYYADGEIERIVAGISEAIKEATAVSCAVEVAGVRYRAALSIWEENGISFLYCFMPYSDSIFQFSITPNYVSVPDSTVTAVMAGYPMTIKVYAT